MPQKSVKGLIRNSW